MTSPERSARRRGDSRGDEPIEKVVRAAQMRTRTPQRTCVACRTERAKRELVRVVRSPAGALGVDPRGKAPGRGAYVCPDPACLERGLGDGAIARALEVEIDADTAARLRSELEDARKVRIA